MRVGAEVVSVMSTYAAITLTSQQQRLGKQRMLVMRLKPAPLMHMAYQISRLVSCFRREVAENCALLGYYAASTGNSLSTFRDNLSVPFSKFNNLENGRHATFFRSNPHSSGNPFL